MTGPIGQALDPQGRYAGRECCKVFLQLRPQRRGQIRVQAFAAPASLRNTDIPLVMRGAAPIGHDKLAGAMKI
ncbi:uncharacterized protein N7484_002443 [Penicillium longicatenatum]|uniref:uncharacterized protein n=1 Tax=Penicillium longicatenatum TaxID=1561947 RepID=UPI0025488EBA|nr:uncharacterized protein N7484_002443 [Penicillium longicatenatum]KAJ5658794.1 hypothetical protein N7484_002443 [Penicillium longicatenatum]KAJ5664516.1 hypothetical protein N7507_005247 [Penicillium longicatenatum]